MFSLPSGFPRVYYLRYDNQSRTLTCTSYGGPATTVTWRRNGTVITLNATYQQTKRVVNAVWGMYQTVLTIDPSVVIVGAYNCTVGNARGRSSRIVVIGELISIYALLIAYAVYITCICELIINIWLSCHWPVALPSSVCCTLYGNKAISGFQS